MTVFNKISKAIVNKCLLFSNLLSSVDKDYKCTSDIHLSFPLLNPFRTRVAFFLVIFFSLDDALVMDTIF